MKQLILYFLSISIFFSFNVNAQQSSNIWIIPYSIDNSWNPSFNPKINRIQIKNIIQLASKDWESCGIIFLYNGYKKVTPPDFGRAQNKDGPIIYFSDSLPENNVAGLTHRETAQNGQVLSWRIELVESRNRNKDDLYAQVLHEFGHAIGLNHTTNIQSIMFYKPSQSKILEEDLIECKKIVSKWTPELAKQLGAYPKLTE